MLRLLMKKALYTILFSLIFISVGQTSEYSLFSSSSTGYYECQTGRSEMTDAEWKKIYYLSLDKKNAYFWWHNGKFLREEKVVKNKSTYKTDIFNLNNKRVNFNIIRYKPDAKKIELKVIYEGQDNHDSFYCKKIKKKDMSPALFIYRVE